MRNLLATLSLLFSMTIVNANTPKPDSVCETCQRLKSEHTSPLDINADRIACGEHCQVTTAGNKIALLVAVSDYPAASGWMKINSVNDLVLIKAALLKQGYSEENITVLKNEEATREGILSAIANLTSNVNRGDIVYFQYSGHGQQVADDNGDEADGYDEAIVPVNSPMKYQEGVNEGQFLIRDDELGNAFLKIRQKLTKAGNLLVVLDACHSGTGTRGFGVARGTSEKMASKTYSTSQPISRGGEMNSLNEGVTDATDLAPMVSFFGAAHNQLNFETTDDEGNGVGSLTYAFSKKFAQAPADMTYRGLFEQVKLEMSSVAPRQSPQAEGMLDQQILGGSILGQADYQKVLRYKDEMTVVVEGGWLKGMNEGSLVDLYPPETRDRESVDPIAKGKVISSNSTGSTLELETPLSREKALAAWAFVTQQNFGNLSVNVALNFPEGELKTAVAEKLGSLPVVNLTDQAELIFVQNGDKLELVTDKDQELKTFATNQTIHQLLHKIKQSVFAYAQSKFLRDLEYSNPRLSVSFEMIPVKYDARMQKETARQSINEKTDAAGTIRFKAEQEVIKIKVTNDGMKPAYFTLLDIQPDNQINVLIPGMEETPEEYRINPGESWEVPTFFEIYPPYGTEVFKLIATTKAVDLRSVVSSQGRSSRGTKNSDPVETLFAQSFFNDDTMSRGGKTVSIGASGMSVFSRTFVIE